ncbi:MAG: hypothetical protein ACRD3I_05635 [Terriglobales bacterium]
MLMRMDAVKPGIEFVSDEGERFMALGKHGAHHGVFKARLVGSREETCFAGCATVEVESHTCVGGVEAPGPSWWEHDARGIPLCRVCDRCQDEKLAGYRPEILSGYDQDDVDEPIEEEG